jgi:hypothetical protein
MIEAGSVAQTSLSAVSPTFLSAAFEIPKRGSLDRTATQRRLEALRYTAGCKATAIPQTGMSALRSLRLFLIYG